jgi:RHS repeat-associated protein
VQHHEDAATHRGRRAGPAAGRVELIDRGHRVAARVAVAARVDRQLRREPKGCAPRSRLRRALGSTVALTDSGGNVVNRYSYDPFGAVTSSTEAVDNSFQFAGGLYGASVQLNKFGQRFFDPSLGRWTTPDPIDRAGIRLGNDWLYAGDDPVNLVDPTGEILDVFRRPISACGVFLALACQNGDENYRTVYPEPVEQGVGNAAETSAEESGGESAEEIIIEILLFE